MTNNVSSPEIHQTKQYLGYLGLIPFVGLSAIVSLKLTPFHVESLAALNIYAFGIIAFLCGTAWPKEAEALGKIQGITSNAVFLVAFFSFILLSSHWLIIAACLLVVIHLLEYKTNLLGGFSDHYHRLRCRLTLIASLSLALAYSLTA